MTEVLSRRDTCRLCGSQDLDLALPLAPSPIGDAFVPEQSLGDIQPTYPLDVFLCRACGHVQLLDVIDAGVLYNDYIYTTTSSPGLPEHFQRYADEVLAWVTLPEGSLIVDIGSNDGTLLRAFKNRGMRVLGVEPASHIAKNATSSGIETVPAFFDVATSDKIKAKHGPAALITANNIFANVDDLAELASGIRGLLAQDGVFIIETGYLVDLVQNTIFDNVYHEHLGYHSIQPLKGFLENHGMEMIDVAKVSSKGGSLRALVQIDGGPRPVAQAVDEMIHVEESLGVHRVDTMQAMGSRLDSVKSDLTSLLSKIKAEGKSVAGYGASQSVTTLMYHFGLTDELSFLVDDNPVKQGLYSPGCHVPVLSPRELYQRNPDYVIILAWRFSEPIINMHQRYLDQGGHFIVPLPDVAVL